MHPYVTDRIGSSSGVMYDTCSGCVLFSMYCGMESIGPGRNRLMPAMMSSRQSGFRFFIKRVMPPLSSWKIPTVLPSDIML